ncbi:MAG: NYN domain-containing protein [Acidobacteriaceae bacterium]|nr:NYN domain-containing protein [Acidobacteriaceae bacterium]
MMQERLNIAVFVDYDNIEIGVKSTLRRDFDVSLPLDALKERGDIVAKFAYANWGRQEGATRQMAENAVQMVQRIPSPRGDKNGADINLALDALEMAFTHAHVNAFAIVSGDSDFIPLVNKLKEYGKTVFVVGGKAFTSTILQQNCHEFVSYESLLEDGASIVPAPMPTSERRDRGERPERQDRKEKRDRGPRPAPLDLTQALPLVERALQVLERRAVQPQLGLLKSTMLQLDPAFSERAYGANSFSDFVEKLKKADFVNVSGSGGRYIIERRGGHAPEKAAPKPEEALPQLRDMLETHRMELEEGATAEELEQWMQEEHPDFSLAKYGFQQFSEFLNYAQDKTVVRTDLDEERGPIVHLGAEFYPPALPEPTPEPVIEEEEDEPQPIVEGQPTIFEPNPPPPKPKKTPSPRKRAAAGTGAARRPRKRKPE